MGVNVCTILSVSFFYTVPVLFLFIVVTSALTAQCPNCFGQVILLHDSSRTRHQLPFHCRRFAKICPRKTKEAI